MFTSKFYVHGDQNVKVPAHLNFGKYMLDKLQLKSDEVAVENATTGVKLTYKEFTQYAVNLSVSLTKLGVRRGDTVAVGSEVRNELFPTILGIVFTGATYTCYEIKSGRAVLKHKLDLSKPRYFICSNFFWDAYGDVLKSFRGIQNLLSLDDGCETVMPIKILSSIQVDVNLFEPAQVQGQEDIVGIYYSSGTTGRSKGVQVTHLNCIVNSLPDDIKNDSLKNVFIMGLWYHTYDMYMVYKFLSAGRKIVYINEITPHNFLKCIEVCSIDITFVIPSLVNYLSNTKNIEQYNLDSLQIIYCVSWPLHIKTIENVKKRLPKLKKILQGYGMTETGVLTSESWGSKGPKLGSVGMALPGVTLKVVDPETRNILGPNNHGEICIRGSVLMKGYIGVESSTYLDEEGFFKTGDLGYYDEDGYFYIVDRLKEVILCNGEKMPPIDLESVLLSHPGVLDVGVVGKPISDLGEEPTAFVVKQPGSNVSEKELIDYVAVEAPPFMQLKGGVKFIKEIPRNFMGKILRHQLRELL